jgi:hypothetical protein
MFAKLVYFCAMSLFCGQGLQAFSLDTVTGWFGGAKDEEIFIKEYPIKKDGKIELAATRGDVTISTWKHDKVMVQVSKNGTQEQIQETEISIKQTPSTLKITTNGTSAKTDYTIIIPSNAAMETVVTGVGDVKVKNSNGIVYVSAHSGTIKLYNNTGTVSAHANSGDIKVKLNHSFNNSSSLLLKAGRGDVTLQAPTTVSAQLDAQTHKGKITSDLPITLRPQKTTLSTEAWKRMQKEVKGTFGSGGAPITIDVENGDIVISER